ncbi:aminoacyl-histidine dipeptidase [Azoarcus sp. DN11]|uniref:aminoacyl-histidine dipeptidase n=1 Tax=Azoarcus sp. DN11 TaxID=356837 RepID=UPI000EB34CA9|nr:aminoacyl-histidine dipeptidase [Azoarcus sp. DN11]AYH44224.1 cytosol nonspecific dipeptidase [Azoarcus sp. DN11]
MSESLPSVLSALEPAAVWAHFSTLCGTPRQSKAEDALRDRLSERASSRGLAVSVDAAGNLLIRKPASRGCEAAPGVVLQAHLDMVCQKTADSPHDFSRDPIRVLRDGDWLTAVETTLGADNGIGVALILAVLEDDTLVHGPIEALLTVDEEAGMGGAQGLAAGVLQGRLMLNLDTEEWGEFFIGCAGGLDVNVQRAGRAEACPAGMEQWRVAVHGLRGGHSGVDVHEERGNAIKLLVRVLRDLERRFGMRLAELEGGSARNALPRDAWARVALPAGRRGELEAVLTAWQARLREELHGVDEGVSVRVVPVAETRPVMAAPEQAMWLGSLHAAPHGVRRRSLSVPGVVETSNNLGIVVLRPDGGSCSFMVRSLLDGAAIALGEEIVSLFGLSGTSAVTSGHYPGWAPQADSPLLALCRDVYRHEFGAESQVQVIHAGLECGLIAAKYPDMQIVSFGPTIRGAHAPGERVEIASVGRVWHLLGAILAATAGKSAA